MENLIKKQQEIENEINQMFQSFERKYERIDHQLEGTPEALLRRRSFIQRSKYLTDMSQQCYGEIMQLVSRSVEINNFEQAHYILRSLYNDILTLFNNLQDTINNKQE